jgi:serine/threonine protein kinase
MQIAKSTNEPIPGYKVRERLGAGGYGEVWTVEAPGGLEKAIKFVYGYLDEERASRELKALDRIKSVRHPFLISLERIEVVEGQLVIVTELAEGSLKDRFDECQKEGLPGIPKNELLMYVRDAADALDYMSESYSLQHLDIKPENLLTVGRHVKVADFGLVKELHDVTGSLMGGLTPLYAPPESFEGRPSRHSDQYSLAIVYQEMLTGILPFPGTTAAQLAALHLHGKPRVESLPPAEQQIILKALAKDPNKRFSTCSELVEHLQLAASGRSNPPAVDSKPLSGANASAASQLAHVSQLINELNAENPVRDPLATEVASAPSHSRPSASPVRKSGWSIPPVAERPHVASASPLQIDEAQFQLRPTLFVGIGGTASHILSHLSHRLHDRFGGETIPIFRSLLLETDGNSAMQVAHAANGSFDSDQVMILPLRRPQDYRNTSRSLLESISRRWIYNIPRSQQTEGIRPLGRLAFADHADKVRNRLNQEISAIVQSDSIERAEKLLKTSVDSTAPRICIVSSVSGGTGGGMLMDVAYTVKQTLSKLGLPDDDVHALLCHSTPRSQAAKDLAIANSYACLSEVQHYSRADRQFPGDSASGLKPLRADEKVFKEISVVHLGDELGQREFEAGTKRAAEFLYLDTATPCGLLFAKRHGVDESQPQREPWDVRAKTFGLFELGDVLEEVVNEAAQHVCSQVVQRWRGQPAEDKHRISMVQTASAADPENETNGSSLHGEATQLAGDKVVALGLNQETLMALSQNALESVFGADAQSCYQELKDRVVESGSDKPSLKVMIDATETLFGPRATELNQADELVESIRQGAQRHLADNAGEIGSDLSAWILSLLDRPTARLKGAEQVAEWIKTYLRDLQDKFCESEQQALQELSSIPSSVTIHEANDKPKSRGRSTSATDANTAVQGDPAWRYFQLRWLRIAAHQARQFAQSIAVHAGGAADQLRDLGREFSNLERQFCSTLSDSSVAPAANSPNDLSRARQEFRERLRQNLGALATELDESFCSDHFAPLGGMHSFVTGDTDVRSSTPVALFATARRIIRIAKQQMDISELLIPCDVDAQESGAMLHSVLESTAPQLDDCGGRRWLTVALPEQANQQRVASLLAEQCQQQASFVTDTDSDVVFLTTIDDVPLSQIAVRLIDGRPDYAEAASRLYTRCDINWTPWDDVRA